MRGVQASAACHSHLFSPVTDDDGGLARVRVLVQSKKKAAYVSRLTNRQPLDSFAAYCHICVNDGQGTILGHLSSSLNQVVYGNIGSLDDVSTKFYDTHITHLQLFLLLTALYIMPTTGT
jgi:hypothetical protein